MAQNNITSIDIIKFLGAISILLLGFLRKGGYVGEKADDQYFQDYLNKQDTASTEILPTNHSAATTTDFTTLCNTNAKLCSKISFVGDFLSEQKSNYLENEIKIGDFLDKNNIISSDFISTLKTMKINNEEGTRRGYATRDTVVLNIGTVQSDQEFNQLSCHELGHIFDLGFIQGTNPTKDTNFTEFNKPAFANNDPSLLYYTISRKSENTRKSTAKNKNFCSGYGMSNPFEDFAECFNLYLNHNKFFKYIAKKDDILAQKYNFIATLLQGKYINASTSNLALVKTNANWRNRDTTKIEIN